MKAISCEFNMDTACVELRLDDGTLITIDTSAVENEVAGKMYQRSELDQLIYNAPSDYADLVLNGDIEKYLKAELNINCLIVNSTTAHRRNPVGSGYRKTYS